FNTCRIPSREGDKVHMYPPAGNHHVLVLRRSCFFIVHATTADGTPLSYQDIQSQLHAVVSATGGGGKGRGAQECPVGALTALGRDEWADARDQLLLDGNGPLLERAQSAALVVCLDDEAPMDRAGVARGLWHGNGRNRFFDKSVQLVVFANGKAGMLNEHSLMDGGPVLRLADFMLKKTMRLEPSPETLADAPTSPVTPPLQLYLGLSPASRRAIANAEASFDKLVNEHDVEVLMFPGYGSSTIKKFKMSPDGFVQMAIQLAVFYMTGDVWGTYEPAQTRAFLHGRTACIRTVSVASVAWVRAMCKGDRLPTLERLELLRDAVKSHSMYAGQAAQGKDIDRHFFGLSNVLQEGESAALFEDPAFSLSKRWRVSTSNVTHEQFDGWGWGEVVPDAGVGIAYMIKKRSMHFNVASLRRPEAWPRSLCHCLQEALLNMQVLCEQAAVEAVGSKL
ncbi:unnamed protein product, partial [Discosporangium mesarthrocarpum]